MSKPKRVGELEVHEDIARQNVEWKIERIGWVLMAIVLLAALAGLLGPGPLSAAKARANGLEVEYDRFVRYQSPTIVRVWVDPGEARQGKIRLSLTRRYIENSEVKHIDPEPESVEVAGDRLTYTFLTGSTSQTSAITYQLEPNMSGPAALSIGLDPGGEVNLHQFIYP